MLSFLSVKDFALIEHTELEFAPGFNVITGESGAGKSILMHSLSILLGERVDRSVIRSGCKQAIIAGTFEVGQQVFAADLRQKLENWGVPWEPDSREITLRRVIGSSATRNFINDCPVSAKLLAALGEELVDFHGAGEQFSLSSPAYQLELLDRFCDTGKERELCRKCASELQKAEEEAEQFDGNLPDERELERLELLVEDVSRVNPLPGEDEEVNSQYHLASNARQLRENTAGAVNILSDGEDSIMDRLSSVYHLIREMSRCDERSTLELLEDCEKLQSGVDDFSRKLQDFADRVELDGEELERLNNRLQELYQIKRRYGPALEDVLQGFETAKQRLADYHRAGERRQELHQAIADARKRLIEAAKILSVKRKNSAGSFLKKILSMLKFLGFADCRFEAVFGETEPGANGGDTLDICFSANPGEELRPLRRIASSGELSRLMLAMKSVLADADAVPTVIFDEIDMNIGGETANHVGDELRNLGKSRQIISISHLAQVAARADMHYIVSKRTVNQRTSSTVSIPQNRVPELARMLGGGKEAEIHAATLLKKLQGKPLPTKE